MNTENIFCTKCGSKQQGNAFCSKCGNQLIVDTHIEEPKNQKEDIPKAVIEENSEIEQQQINSLIDNNKNNHTDTVSTLKIILHFVFKFVIFVFIFGALSRLAQPLIAQSGFFAFVPFIVSAILTSFIKISKNERIKKISAKTTSNISFVLIIIAMIATLIYVIKLNR